MKDDKAIYSSLMILSTCSTMKANQSLYYCETNEWEQSELITTLPHASPQLFLLSNEPYISCRAVPFDWCLKVMWHYYGMADHRENTPIHSCSERSAPPVFSQGSRSLEKAFKVRGENSSSVAQPCFCSLGLLSQSNPLQQTEWPACAYAAVAVLVQVVSC